jgi:hypothetical protein
MKKKQKTESVVIIPKLPADARRNLAKLERRTAKVNPRVRRIAMNEPDAKTIKIIYRDEGADACLRCCKHYKMSRRQMLLLLAGFERQKGEA